MRRLPWRGRSEREGYALVAAMLIMFLLTIMGIMAMVTSTSEQRITFNLGEDKQMFNYGEQGVDRVLSHLHYLNQGLFGLAEGAHLTDNNPIQVLNDVRALFISGNPVPLNLTRSPTFNITAWMDPKNADTTLPNPALDQGYSREIAVSIAVTNVLGGFTRAFRAKVRPYSIWDFAYFSQNHNPISRSTVAGCNGDPWNWYDCQTVFHQEDTVAGDIYVRTAESALNDSGYNEATRFYMRGAPAIGGRVMWRNLARYDYGSTSYGNSLFQTKGGSVNGPSAMRNIAQGFTPHVKEASMFPIRYLTTSSSFWYRGNADLILEHQDNRIFKILFRNDIDTNGDVGDGIYEKDSHVASHYNSESNNGNRDSDDYGAMLIYQLPWSNPPTDAQKRVAFYGNNMKPRDAYMLAGGGERWSPTATFDSRITGSGKCYHYRDNNPSPGISTHPPEYIPSDISPRYYYTFVPSVGVNRGNWGVGCSGASRGIIFVEGDVMVEGILDGKTTIVATGNIWLTHEVQYEERPKRMDNYSDVNNMDMLGLFATGNIIIPNSYPNINGSPTRGPYIDDWSDAGDEVFPGSASGYQGTGDRDMIPMQNDDGNEEIDAVMVSFGYGACGYGNSDVTCVAPTANSAQVDLIKNFKVGIYATPRTADGTTRGTPKLDQSSAYDPSGNYSGKLTIFGAMIQNYPGRVSYDHVGSTCTTGSGCRNIGHRLNLRYDERLKYTLPPIPRMATANGGIPYGQAAWEIVSWEQISSGNISDPVW